ncbi:hypothetical protein AB4Y32_03970 [Paraburkholderia phymatum]|uniref:Uncharacterized protein n=1 Tax=Paraburkholderia phymatum TaxID=148447 RepID=A0ACC6TUM0_9BURK
MKAEPRRPAQAPLWYHQVSAGMRPAPAGGNIRRKGRYCSTSASGLFFYDTGLQRPGTAALPSGADTPVASEAARTVSDAGSVDGERVNPVTAA